MTRCFLENLHLFEPQFRQGAKELTPRELVILLLPTGQISRMFVRILRCSNTETANLIRSKSFRRLAQRNILIHPTALPAPCSPKVACYSRQVIPVGSLNISHTNRTTRFTSRPAALESPGRRLTRCKPRSPRVSSTQSINRQNRTFRGCQGDSECLDIR